MDKTDVEIGLRLKKLREYQGYSQQDLAGALKLHRPAVSLIESGERKMSALELLTLSRLFKLPVAFILDEPVDPMDLGVTLRMAMIGLEEEDRQEVIQFAEFLHFRKKTSKE